MIMKASLVANPKVKVESLRIATINLGGKNHWWKGKKCALKRSNNHTICLIATDTTAIIHSASMLALFLFTARY